MVLNIEEGFLHIVRQVATEMTYFAYFFRRETADISDTPRDGAKPSFLVLCKVRLKVPIL